MPPIGGDGADRADHCYASAKEAIMATDEMTSRSEAPRPSTTTHWSNWSTPRIGRPAAGPAPETVVGDRHVTDGVHPGPEAPVVQLDDHDPDPSRWFGVARGRWFWA